MREHIGGYYRGYQGILEVYTIAHMFILGSCSGVKRLRKSSQYSSHVSPNLRQGSSVTSALEEFPQDKVLLETVSWPNPQPWVVKQRVFRGTWMGKIRVVVCLIP